MPNDLGDDKNPGPPVSDGATPGVAAYWNKPLHELGRVEVEPSTPEWAERHRIYSLLTMAPIYHYWNGNKSGAEGSYPWRESQKISDGRYRGDRQFGGRAPPTTMTMRLPMRKSGPRRRARSAALRPRRVRRR